MTFDSLWQDTAIASSPYAPLRDRIKVDVAIVGAGYTGLSAALHLCETGAKIAVLDAHEPGWGASGRNGGQVIPGLKYDPDELMRKFGPDLGPRLVDFVGGAPGFVFDLIEKHGMKCDHKRCGWIQPAHNTKMLDTLHQRARQWLSAGADVEVLEHEQLCNLLGTRSYVGGWLDRRGGSLNPLSFARSLASSAAARGVSIYPNTPAQSFVQRGAGYEITTPGGPVEAQQLVIATNGYTDNLLPGLRQTVIPAHSFQVCTGKIDRKTLDTILTQGHVASDSRRILLYFRKYDDRVLMGGVGSFDEPRDVSFFRHLEQALVTIFPQMGQCKFDHHWFGRVALTADFVPHLQEPLPGVFTALGYNGRGIAMATAMGSLLARRVNGEPAETLPFPTTRMTPIPFHGLRRLYVGAARTYYRIRDTLG